MTTLPEQFAAEIDYNWSDLKAHGFPRQFPAWVEKLQDRVELWLDGESFSYIEFGRDSHGAFESTKLTVFGITERFVLYVAIEKGADTADHAANVSWHLVVRTSINHLDFSHVREHGRTTLLLTAGWDGIPDSIEFPPVDRYEIDADARRALFLSLRHDLFPPA